MVPFQKFRMNFDDLEVLNAVPDEGILSSMLE
jgi:hypothetical protein